ncbi:MAG: murein L,D-transpeptidase catalytic domain family protein [Chitinophagaceae bacterium]|jgi:hypothetical protein|nr:murein L,D-transpeptidase catalytic domain family protein [Chitinophagaceae bacterium]
MKRQGILLVVILLCSCLAAFPQRDTTKRSAKEEFKSFFPPPVSESSPQFKAADSVYRKTALYTYGLDQAVFYHAYKGYQYLLSQGKLSNPDLLTIADYSQSSKNRRLYVLDMKEGKVLFNTFVSHGKNSGIEWASDFSNSANSNKSSLGFMVTAETYIGGSGYSLRLDGVEDGINNQVRLRNVVMHGSKFVNYERIYERGTIGNSLGCPAIPMSDHRQVIDKIKGGSCLFIYSNIEHYKRSSAILNATFDWPVLKKTAPVEVKQTSDSTSRQL